MNCSAKLFLTLFFMQLLPTSIFSAEVDNFSERNYELKDATNAINRYGNQLFISILEKTNEQATFCDETKLYKNLRKEFRNSYIGKFSDFIAKSKEIERTVIPHKKSIYSLFTTKDAYVTGFLSNKVFDPSAHILNVKGHLIGTDKFEHFTGTGYRYFNRYYLEKTTLEQAVELGFNDEYGILGAWSTGVISYGDLAAEFNGMRFWNHILQKDEDILNENIGPYVVCENNKWRMVKNIDWSFYVDDSWDEAINCSEFRTWTMVAKVKYKLRELSKKTNKSITCPLYPEKTRLLQDKYHQFSPYLLNFKGISIKSK